MAALCLAVSLSAQSDADGQAANKGRILLALPFDNHTGQPSLEWVREAAPEILGARFASAGFAPMSRADRHYAYDHLGLPKIFQPSRASALKLAQTFDADSIVVGSYSIDGGAIVAEARIVDVPGLRMSQPVSERGDLRDLLAVFNGLAWKLTRQLDPNFNVARETFVKASSGMKLQAFEQYIRGITEQDRGERLRRLNNAVKLSPDLSPAWMELGREQYSGQQYEDAAASFAKVDRNDPDALEAGFYRGVALLFLGDYAKAEEAFAGVARALPLAPVINNQALAQSRNGKDGTALFRQAVGDDPTDADYHFNLAVSLHRHGEKAEALTELKQCLRLHPNDAEAQDLERQWMAQSGAAQADPLERIARTFDAQAFRQAAQLVDQMESSRLQALPPQERARAEAAHARGYLDRGLLLEAERIYLGAIGDDPKSAEAHAGLALLRERTGDLKSARKEALEALENAPSADAYLVLGRSDLVAGHIAEAKNAAHEAQRLAPQSREAQDLSKQVEAKEKESPTP